MYCVKLFSVSWTMPLNKSQVNYLIKVYFYLKRKYLSYTNSLITVHRLVGLVSFLMDHINQK